jgi:hypothetical protein
MLFVLKWFYLPQLTGPFSSTDIRLPDGGEGIDDKRSLVLMRQTLEK